eukprot:Skav221004  [mRNA]  locus=scaffold1846:71194:78195:+ [translate_table: standard]
MQALIRRGEALGLNQSEISSALSLNRPANELAWVASPDLAGQAPQVARDILETNRVLEYECYDDTFRSQGRAVVTLKEREDPQQGLFLGEHGPCSDEYYEYFVEHTMKRDGGLYHICEGPAQRSVLAAEAAGARAPEEGDGKKRKERSPSPPEDEEELQEYLQKQASRHQARKRAKKKKEAKRGKSSKKKKKGKKGDHTGTSSGSSGVSSSSGFHLTPVRGGQELWRTAQKKPGRLTQKALAEMTRYLANRVEDGELETRWKGQRMMAYLNQITFAAHPPAQVGLRTARELQTVAVTLDHLLAGRLRMEDGKALGDYTSTARLPGPRGRARDGHPKRASRPEAQGELGQGGKEQIGSRQRAAPEGKGVREPPKRSLPGKEETLGRREGAVEDGGEGTSGDFQRGADQEGSAGEGRQKTRVEEAEPPTRTVLIERKSKRREIQRQTEREMVGRKEQEMGQRKRKGQFESGLTKRSRGGGRPSGEEESADELTPGKVRELMDWLKGNDCQHLTAAQVSQHIIIQAITLNGAFGQLLEMSLRPTREDSGRVRNLMPLPLWPDSRDALEEVVTSLRYRDRPGEWRSRGATKSRANKQLRVDGILRWHGLITVALNFLHAGGSIEAGRGPPGATATVAQEKALLRIWEMVKTFLDEKEPKKGVPRTPSGSWEEELEKLRVSYQGEVTEKARPLTLSQILPGLPSADHGGLVDILEVVDEKMRRKLERPEVMVREDVPEEIPRPQVLCEDGEWEQVVKALYDRHLVIPISQHPVVQGEEVLNGAFGVVKPDRFTEAGDPILRMIFDLRASNTILDQLEGDVRTLCGAAGFQKLLIEEGNQVLVSGDDLTAAFYLFRLPERWANYMALRKPVRKSLFQEGAKGTTMVGVTVLPMGWSSAVAIMQNAHRQLALRTELRFGAALMAKAEIRRDSVFPDLQEDCPAWAIYLDDTTFLETVADGVAEELKGQPAEMQEKMRQVYGWWGIPVNKAKALERVQKAERLGALLDGKKGVLRASTKRCLDLIGLGSWIRSSPKVARKALQIYAGKAVHILQFRRPLFSVMDALFKTVAAPGERPRLDTATCDEMLLLEALLPTAQCDLRARLDPVVTASDACESGGGACFASRLSRMGEDELRKLMEQEEPGPNEVSDDFREAPQKVIVIDLFAGIGGLQRSLELAGLTPWFKVAIEKDAACRRCLRKEFPGVELVSDIKKVTPKMVKGWLHKIPDADGVVVGGGSPCQGLSSLNADRLHLEDPRSALFHDAVKVIQMVESEAKRQDMWVLKFVENVVSDEADIRAMSAEMEVRPVLVDSSGVSRARRPRLFWMSVPLVMHEEVELHEQTDYDVVSYTGATEQMQYILDDGWSWKAGESSPAARFPTFTRAIKRAHPPKSPAGLSHTPEEARQRWETHQYRFPPYTYKEEFVVEHSSGIKRVLNANERELLMGFQRGHTLSLAKKVPSSIDEERELEDLRLAAIGNSFHCVAVACLLDHATWSMGVKALKGHHLIVAEAEQERKESFEKAQAFPELDALSDQSAVEVAWPDDDGLSETENLSMEHMNPRLGLSDLTPIEGVTKADLKLSVMMVNAFLRRQEYRGSDVRLDVGTLYRPNCCPRATVNPQRWKWHEIHHYRFEREEHINVLELRAYIHTMEWRLRNAGMGDVRALHLCDSQVVIAVCTKGRSSSRQLNRLLRKLGAMSIAGGLYPILAWIASELNPADGPSRYYERLVSEYIEFLWEEGYPKAEASYTLAAIQFYRPQSKGHLVWAWKLVKAWNQLELPTRATPLTPELLLSLAGQCFKWKQFRLGWLLVLGFSGMFRTTELLTLKKKDVVLPAPHQKNPEAILLLPTSKGSKRCLLPLDKIVIDEAIGIRALRELCANIQPGETLAQLTNHQFRRLWAELLQELSLNNQGYQPYSLRRLLLLNRNFVEVSMLHVTQLDRIVDVVEEASRGRVVTLLEKTPGAGSAR